MIYGSTGRALLFNFSAVVMGFGVLLISNVPPLNRLGGLIGARPKTSLGTALTLALAVSLGSGVAGEARAQRPSGDQVAANINARDEGVSVSRKITMELIDKRGKSRERQTRSLRKYYGDDKKTAIFYLSPKNIKDTAFLTYDYAEAKRDDDQWLYLPALRKVRRISASDRGDYFLGTDLTYDDIKRETKVTPEDYTWTTVGEETVDGHECWVVEALPENDAVARELGYSKVVSRVDKDIWMVRGAEFWDIRGNPLKTTRILDIRQVQDIWTYHRVEVDNHKTGHRTIFDFSEIDYTSELDDDLFSERGLRRGLR